MGKTLTHTYEATGEEEAYEADFEATLLADEPADNRTPYERNLDAASRAEERRIAREMKRREREGD